MRSISLWLHRWLGLTIGLVLVFIGLTGSALVFRPELDAQLHPQLLQVKPRAEQVLWQSMEETVRGRYPQRQLNHIFVARDATSPHVFWLDGGELRAYVDPYSGRILGERGETGDLFSWLAEAHIHLLSGDTGQKVAGWCGLVLAALSLSGLILWFPRTKGAWKRAFAPRWKTNWKGRNYEMHRVGGFYLAGFLLVASLSGAALTWHEPADAFAAFLFGAKPVAQTPPVEPGQRISLDALIANADAAFPEGRLGRVSFPVQPDAPLTIRKKLPDELHPYGLNFILLDGTTGRVLQVEDSRRVNTGQRLLNLRYPLHLGLSAGNFTRVLAVLVGLSPLLFFVSGFLMWRARFKRRPSTSQ